MSRKPLPHSFYDRDPVAVAGDLLGKWLLRQTRDGLLVGIIVEVEAYLARGDSACHASKGMTRKNASMFGRPGFAYVYPIHSRHCLNVVTEPVGVASAVLIRAMEPIEGVDCMQRNRGTVKLLDIARGPGRLCEALEVDRRLDGWDLTAGRELWIASAAHPDGSAPEIETGPRIGVTSAEDLPLRFFVRGSRFVSGPRSRHAT